MLKGRAFGTCFECMFVWIRCEGDDRTMRRCWITKEVEELGVLLTK